MARKAQGQKHARPQAKAAASAVASPSEPQSTEDWRAECDRLRGELQAARDEIVALKQRQEQVLNRIAWVLDSLETLSQLDS